MRAAKIGAGLGIIGLAAAFALDRPAPAPKVDTAAILAPCESAYANMGLNVMLAADASTACHKASLELPAGEARADALRMKAEAESVMDGRG